MCTSKRAYVQTCGYTNRTCTPEVFAASGACMCVGGIVMKFCVSLCQGARGFSKSVYPSVV